MGFRFEYGENTIVDTDKGKVKGYAYNGLRIFKGIPYAKAKRFHAPEPVDAWEGVLLIPLAAKYLGSLFGKAMSDEKAEIQH